MKQNKDTQTLDLFAVLDSELQNTPLPRMEAPTEGEPTVNVPSIPGLDSQLVQVWEEITNAAKKKFKDLEATKPAEVLQIRDAVAYVMAAKKIAYTRAFSGEIISSLGWRIHQPELAKQIDLLISHSFVISEIPAAT